MKSWLSEIPGPIQVQEAGAGVEAWFATQAAVGKKLVFNRLVTVCLPGQWGLGGRGTRQGVGHSNQSVK